jgi:predicted TIM-barrel fold metal-dependent hydrolase
MEAVALPAELRPFSGRLADVDSHEMMPAQEWASHFGPEVRGLAEAYMAAGAEAMDDPDYPGDVMPVGADIAAVKGERAPGATEPLRRLEVMDAMGIGRQLMFPSGIGLLAFLQTIGKPLPFAYDTGEDPRACGSRWLEIYAEWALAVARSSDRLRPVLPLIGDTPGELYERARRLIDQGAPAFWIASGVLPGGCSPANPELDRFWALAAESGTVVTLHGGGEGRFLRTNEWRNAPAFMGYRTTSEFDFDPWSMSIYHLPSQNFVTTMVFGGVFERHPALRFGVIEVGSHWVGPMMESIDLLYHAFRSPGAQRLSLRPSDYVRSNVRVSALVYDEVGAWIERYPGVEDVLCFSTDYPHPEGGRNAAQRYYDRLARLGEPVVEKFFVANGRLLLPDRP